jgi:hypothetical protein
VDIAAEAMREKGLDPVVAREVRAAFAQRFFTSLHDL